MITKEIKLEDVSLYQMICHVGSGFDICDDEYDWGVYMDCYKSWEECDDYYDRIILLFALNIRCVKYNDDWYSPCKVSEFIAENIKAFRQFFNEENREGYRPMDYENADDSHSDEGFYEAYMMPLESLIAGNYSEDDYEKLYKLLIKEVKEG